MPFSYLEKQVFKRGYQVVAGIDEAGRGSLAGRVAAAIVAVFSVIARSPDESRGDVAIPWQKLYSTGLPRALRSLAMTKKKNTKQKSLKQREEIFEKIKNNSDLAWRVSFVWPKTIDRINIWQATLLTWQRCLKKLNSRPDFLFLDGKFDLFGRYPSTSSRLSSGLRSGNKYLLPERRRKLESRAYTGITQKPIIKGDQKIFLLSLASIIAKVSRDNLMKKLDKKYPEYGFSRHKGYGTKLHLEKLKKIGPSEIHRQSFRPVFDSLSFREKVYYVVSQIPKGQAMTYQAVAQKIGQPKSYRAVGNALNKNIDPKIPCHRVIRSDGKLGGYNRGSKIKEKLLKKERFKI